MAKKKPISKYLEKKKKQAERRYKIGLAFGIPIFLLTIPIYLLFTVFLYPATNSGFLALGVAGSFILGIGLLLLCMNIVDLKNNSWRTFIFCGIPCFVGLTMIIISCVIMYIPEIYDLFDERYVSFYFTMWAFLLFLAFFYILGRFGISKYTLRRRGLSKSAIKAAMKGAKNFWWYEKLHRSHNLGITYYINKWFTVLYAGALTIHIAIGWLKFVMPVIGILLISSSLLLLVFVFPAMCSVADTPNKNEQKSISHIDVLLLGLFILSICCAAIIATVQLLNQ